MSSPRVLQPEAARQLRGRQQLFVLARRPADQREVVHQRLRQVAAFLVFLDERALVAATPLTAREIVERSLRIAADICVYTNDQLTIVEL